MLKLKDKILEALKELDDSAFYPLFHKRARVKKNIGEKIIIPLRAKYRRPWDITVFRLWAFNAKDGEKTQLSCDPDVGVSTLYGYDLQFGLWVQLMGQNNLAKIYFHLVPAKDTWVIGGLHIQQATFLGDDYEKWAQKAISLEEKNRLQAYLHYDITRKLLVGGDFIQFDVLPKVLARQEAIFTKDQFLAQGRQLVKGMDIVHVGTIMPDEGLGIVVRARVKKLLSMPDVQQKCKVLGRIFIKAKWIGSKTGGIKCDFILPQEPAHREGALGSQYLTYADLKRGT